VFTFSRPRRVKRRIPLFWRFANTGSTVPIRRLYVARPIGLSNFRRMRSDGASTRARDFDGPTRFLMIEIWRWGVRSG
jgi:hypothetical protein